MGHNFMSKRISIREALFARSLSAFTAFVVDGSFKTCSERLKILVFCNLPIVDMFPGNGFVLRLNRVAVVYELGSVTAHTFLGTCGIRYDLIAGNDLLCFAFNALVVQTPGCCNALVSTINCIPRVCCIGSVWAMLNIEGIFSNTRLVQVGLLCIRPNRDAVIEAPQR